MRRHAAQLVRGGRRAACFRWPCRGRIVGIGDIGRLAADRVERHRHVLMHDAPLARHTPVAGGYAHPRGAARMVGRLGYEMVHAVDEGDVAIDLDHEALVLGANLLREVREALLPEGAHGLRANAAMRWNGVVENRLRRIACDEGCRILGLDCARPGVDQFADLAFVSLVL